MSVVFDQLIDPDSLSNTTVLFIDSDDPSNFFEADEFVLSSFSETQLVRFFFSDLPEGNYNAVFSGTGIEDLSGNAFIGGDITSGVTLLESLFSENADTVELDNFLASNSDDGVGGLTFLNALGGDDVVVLASDVGPNGLDLGGTTFVGGAGDDHISPINDFMNADGGAGSDTIDFSQLVDQTTGVMVDLTAQTVSGASTIALSSFENVIGTNGDDTVTASLGVNFIDTGAGDDDIFVNALTQNTVDDVYIGGTGTDRLINTGANNLRLNGWDNNNLDGTVNGSGIETIVLAGFAVEGSSSDNSFDFNALQFQQVNNITHLGFMGGGGNETVIGSSTIFGEISGFNAAFNAYELGAGDDSFTGSGSIVDHVFGGDGDDIIDGGAGNDILIGELGADTLRGGEGNDQFFADSASFDTQNDTFIGGAGTDAVVNTTDGNLRLDNWDNTDANGTANGSGVEAIRLGTDGFIVEGSAGDDSYNFGATRFEQVDNDTHLGFNAGAGNDTVIGSTVASLSLIHI